MVNLGFLLIKHRRGGRSVAPQDELHHFLRHNREWISMAYEKPEMIS